jgi:sugar lactone lactonase YvrE
MRRHLLSLSLVVLLAPATATASSFPSIIELPNGFGPEGIAIRAGTPEFYVGSIPTGAVYKGDLRSGQGEVLVEGREGRAAIGLKVDRRQRLFVSGGPTGKAFVYDARDGDDLAEYTLAPAGSTFINDVVVTPRGAFFTDSRAAALSVLPLDEDGGLPGQDEVRSLPLTGDFQPAAGPNAFNLNGIASNLSGSRLLAVQTATGKLFLIDSRTGATNEIEVAGAPSFPNGDGLLLRGRRLYVVQNQLNQVSVVQLSQDLDEAKGTLLRVLTDPALAVPTTIARSGSRYYVVNARFGTPVTPETEYDVVKLPGR